MLRKVDEHISILLQFSCRVRDIVDPKLGKPIIRFVPRPLESLLHEGIVPAKKDGVKAGTRHICPVAVSLSLRVVLVTFWPLDALFTGQTRRFEIGRASC